MEEKICKRVIELLGIENQFGIEHRSTDYTSLVFCDNDFFRVKYTDKSKWISIRLAKEDKNPDDPRFAAQKNKGQLHWKAKINDWSDIDKFEDVLINACVDLGGKEYKPRDINHGKITIETDGKEITIKG